MEIIRGKQTSFLNAAQGAAHTAAHTASQLHETLSAYDKVHMDIGTGDGRFVRHLAQAFPHDFVIGIDANRQNLHKVSRVAPANALFVVANGEALPAELYGLAASVTLNFPWGSLLHGLLTADSLVLTSIQAIMGADAELTVRLNAGALAEAGRSFEAGIEDVSLALMEHGFMLRKSNHLSADALKKFPSTWAKRLAFGRDPRAVCLEAESASPVKQTHEHHRKLEASSS